MKIWALVLLLPLLYLLYVGVMCSLQDVIIFPAASNRRYPLTEPLPATGRFVEIPASFGKVRLFYQPPRAVSAPAPAAIYAHGNFEYMQKSFTLLYPLAQAGVGVLQFEYPGYCGADGKISFDHLIEAETLAYDWLTARAEVDPRRIIAIGHSVGSGVASELTRHRPVAALILLSGYTSLADMAYRYALPGFLLRYPFDNLARLRAYQGPVFITHGRRDFIIPFTMGKKLARSKPGSEFVALDCGHGDCIFENGALFQTRLPAWLAAHGLLTPPGGSP